MIEGKLPVVAQAVAASTVPDPALAHLSAAVELLKNIPGLQDALPGICAQHERFDGTGTPDKLSGEKIPLAGRIVAVARDFDAAIHPEGSNPESEPDAALVKKAFTDLDQQSGTTYDPNVVRALIVSYRHGALRAAAQDEPIRVSSARIDSKPLASNNGAEPAAMPAGVNPRKFESGETQRAPRSSKKKA